MDGEERYSYDANGNMIGRNDGTRTWTLAWTPENMLQTATAGSDSVSLLYDADGMMVARTENGQTTNYLGKLFQHSVTASTFTKQYQFNGQLIALREGLATSSPVSFMTANQLGSTTTTLWADGTVRADQRYTPWGEQRWTSNATPTQYQYTSQRNDSLLGLYDYNARYYDPVIGRFISADIIVPDQAALQSFNRYSYVNNNPLRFSDPTGHLGEDEIQNYFGDYNNAQDMIDNGGWNEDLANWLWNPETYFGDVFTYANSSGDFGEAMLALFETQSAGSGVYEGGFYGVGRLRVGEQVYRSSIQQLNDDTPEATLLEEAFAENFDALPRKTGSDGRNYYDPVMYSDVKSAWPGILGVGAAVGGTAVTIAVAAGCASNPVGWVACMGGGAGLASAGFTLGGLGFSLMAPPNTVDYPLLRLPTIMGNAPHNYGWGQPAGYYQP